MHILEVQTRLPEPIGEAKENGEEKEMTDQQETNQEGKCRVCGILGGHFACSKSPLIENLDVASKRIAELTEERSENHKKIYELQNQVMQLQIEKDNLISQIGEKP